VYIARLNGPLQSAFSDWFSDGPAPAASSPTANTEAFDHYLRGNSLLQEATPASLRAALESFDLAVAADPHFALAFASLAETNLALLNFGYDYDAALALAARENAE